MGRVRAVTVLASPKGSSGYAGLVGCGLGEHEFRVTYCTIPQEKPKICVFM